MTVIDPSARCIGCSHREDQHDTLPDGTRPCRSIGHSKGLTCAECRRLISAGHVQAVMELRGADDDAFQEAWAAYHTTLDHVRKELGSSWTAFFTDVHQSALASAVLTLRARAGLPEGPFKEWREYQVVGGWGVDGAEDAAHARRKVERALAEYPLCRARAEWRIGRSWDDDSEFYGPWQPLTDAED
ncbi:hypothetical protein ABZ619_38955 [Streptomyces sp. NPDC007851]|uniref:hypothetical protein n=1 Tax=Streptomyces sp. NPDC007851 TaxID=3155008 RepID=UPI003409AE2D